MIILKVQGREVTSCRISFALSLLAVSDMRVRHANQLVLDDRVDLQSYSALMSR